MKKSWNNPTIYELGIGSTFGSTTYSAGHDDTYVTVNVGGTNVNFWLYGDEPYGETGPGPGNGNPISGH